MDADAEALEHSISPRLEAALAAHLGEPLEDPHGHPIPTPTGELHHRDLKRLSEFRAGDRVVDSRPRDLRAAPQPGRSSMAEQAPPPHPRILYIEDNPESRTLVRNVLEARGFDVLEASDGIAGIDLAISAHPDLILCDIEMPGIDGYETATRLRSYRGLDGCPIVVLTSHGDRGLSLSIGCDGYIEKPIDVEKFPGQLREFLKGKREKVKTAEERRYLREYSQSLVERLEATVRELTAANSRLRAAARSKTEFMQNLSHELATPLTPITGYLKILKSEKTGPMTEPQRRILDSMQTASERLSRTIDNLVDFATLESGGYAIHRDTFDPRTAAKAVIEEEKPKAKARRITLELVAEPLPETGWGDERKLKQALGNVIDNAIKFSPHGSHVLVRVSADNQRLSFEVYDQGEGMLAEEAEKVFDPFFHADRVGDERAPGAGLGLPVAKQIIEAHGGRISAESPPKNQPESRSHFSGTRVSFWIPLRPHPPKEPQPTVLHESAPEGGTS